MDNPIRRTKFDAFGAVKRTLEDPMRLTRCRSCPENVMMLPTPKGGTMPVNPHTDSDGNVWLDHRTQPPTARTVSADNPAPKGARMHKSHFATCPAGDHHRRKQRRPQAVQEAIDL